MKRVELKVTRIGNSRGVRLPAVTLRRFEIGESVIMEETLEGILLRPNRAVVSKLSWSETAEQIATSDENWAELDVALSDGLDNLAWEEKPRRVAEKKPRYPKKPQA
jgi:antitoxin component of MazEF toxin-antitoxin module